MNKILRFSDSEKVFQCPICKTDLKLKQKSLFCSNHHCFDISKTGYVNFAVICREIINSISRWHLKILATKLPNLRE